jgi:hypothetical protein
LSLTGNNGLLAAAGANQPAYSIDQSVRISEAGGLRRMQTGGNLRKFTFSTWVKPGNIDGSAAYEKCLYSAGNDGDGSGYTDFVYFTPFASGGRQLRMVVSASGALAGSIITTSFFNDPASWYHVVAVWDSANATGADRMIIYVNGTRQAIGTITTPAQNTDALYFNASGKQAVIGNYAYYWNPSNPTHALHATDGFMADTYFVDGSVVAPSVFAETDEDTNQWKPKNNSDVKSAVTFGTNGFYLNYSDSSSLGTDSSGEGNNFTPGNLVATDQVLDSPSNNFATLNDLDTRGTLTLTEGGLRVNSSSSDPEVRGTIEIPQSGKWYWEFLMQHSTSFMIGVVDQTVAGNPYGSNQSVLYSSGQGTNYNFSSVSSNNWGATWTTGDIMGVAFNRDDNQIIFYKNNSAQPTLTIGGTAAQRARLIPVFATGTSGTGGGTVNFGQDSSFHGTKTAQGNGGVGEDFYYTPPTGFKALNTDNLDDPAIALPTAHFNTVLYTGDASNPKTVSGVGFSADMVWLKSRGISQRHNIYDTVRGIPKSGSTDVPRISPDDATAESDTTDELRTVTSDGFTVDTSRNGSGNTYVAWNWKGSDTPTKTFAVTVTNPGSGNRYTLDGKVSGTNAMPITIEEGGTYTFDQSDNSNSGHPLRFSTTSNGTWGGGSEYTTGVTTNGTPGYAGAYTRITVAASAPTLYYYCTNHSGMGAAITTPGSGGGVSDLSGTIASVVNANTTAGFSIATYTGNGTSPSTIGHGLSVAPEMVMVKNRTTAGENWVVSVGNATGTNGDFLILNTDSAVIAGTSQFPSQPGSSTFAVTDAANVNTNTSNYIAYCFHSVDGYSKVGSYTGNGSTDGTFVYTGFRPTFVMLKDTSAVEDWVIHDTTRAPYNQSKKVLYPNTNGAEEDSSNRAIDIVSNGFKARNNGGRTNRNGDTYIYYVVGYPFKTSNAR